jgi:multidrug resistance efflux pump
MDKASHAKARHNIAGIMKAIGLLALLLILMLWLAGTFFSKTAPGPPLPRAKLPATQTQRVERRMFPMTIEQVGSVQARTQAQVSSRIMAQVKEIFVREGDHVAGGDEKGKSAIMMARLDDRDIQSRLREAESRVTALSRSMEAAVAKVGAAKAQLKALQANHEKMLSDYRRYRDLYQHHAATGQQIEHARTQKEMAEAQMNAARQDVKAAQGEIERLQAQKREAEAAVAGAQVMLSYTQILAPFTGRIVKKNVDIGDMAVPGQPLFLIEIPSQPELHASVSDSLLPRLRVGQPMETHIDALNRTYKGILREIVPKTDPATRTFLVKVSLPYDADLFNGMFGRLAVPYGTYAALVVPSKAVREVGQLYLVDVLDVDGYPQRRFVTLGAQHDDLVEVLSGLKEGEKIVVP